MKEMVKIVDNTKPRKNPEEKIYLICISGHSEDMWNIVTGRTEAYNYIKDIIEDINFEESFILVENCTLNQRKSIYAFMKYCESFFEDSFDIDDYIKGDWSEDDFRKSHSIESQFEAENANRLNMVDVMNGDVESSSLE